eukprot:2322466-Rhodomonas_salina.1
MDSSSVCSMRCTLFRVSCTFSRTAPSQQSLTERTGAYQWSTVTLFKRSFVTRSLICCRLKNTQSRFLSFPSAILDWGSQDTQGLIQTNKTTHHKGLNGRTRVKQYSEPQVGSALPQPKLASTNTAKRATTVRSAAVHPRTCPCFFGSRSAPITC